MKARQLALACWLIAVPLLASAAAEHWQTDPVGTSMEITYWHAGLIDIPAIAGNVTGSVVLDDDAPANSQLDLTADLNSLQSFGDRWARELRDDMFDVAHTPTLRFVSTHIERTGQAYQVTGQLTAHGITRPIMLSMRVAEVLHYTLPTGPHRFRGLTLSGQVPWKDFGMIEKTDPQLTHATEYGESFKLKINFEMIDAPPAAAH
jgi:polyisoprenoid-binding protein YceI